MSEELKVLHVAPEFDDLSEQGKLEFTNGKADDENFKPEEGSDGNE